VCVCVGGYVCMCVCVCVCVCMCPNRENRGNRSLIGVWTVRVSRACLVFVSWSFSTHLNSVRGRFRVDPGAQQEEEA